jgi:glycosyltransferase involved in cell wall biosynthesis
VAIGAGVAVVIPCYKESDTILGVVQGLPDFVDQIIVVDDGCPDGSGKLVEEQVSDPRVKVLFHAQNQGIGAAMVTGFSWVVDNTESDYIVKVDGDGQMDPALMADLLAPLVSGAADYAKGNRFSSLEDLESMPKIRILGNAALSLLSKFSSGYWSITDPTNGYIAIRRSTLKRIKLAKLNKGYFFESDMLFRLSVIGAVVVDVPMASIYGAEKSHLNIRKVIWQFPKRHTVNLLKRIFYNYYLREWNVASIELPLGLLLFIGGIGLGAASWTSASAAGLPATSGQVMLAAVPIILGFQLILAFVSYDVSSTPRLRMGSKN